MTADIYAQVKEGSEEESDYGMKSICESQEDETIGFVGQWLLTTWFLRELVSNTTSSAC